MIHLIFDYIKLSTIQCNIYFVSCVQVFFFHEKSIHYTTIIREGLLNIMHKENSPSEDSGGRNHPP